MRYRTSFEIAQAEQMHKVSVNLTSKVRGLLAEHATCVSRSDLSERIDLSIRWEFFESNEIAPFPTFDHLATAIAAHLRPASGTIPLVGVYCEQQINPDTFEPYLRFWALITPP
jgi:hypothetical protein